MEYDVIEADHLKELISDVNNKIKEGYKPIGGIMIVSDNVNKCDSNYIGSGYIFSQAMIKE